MKELAEELEKQFTCFGENNEKCLSLTLPLEKEVTKIDKNWEEITKICLTCYNLLTVQDFWQAHYHVLSIIFLKEFMKLNVNTDTMPKYAKLMELHMNYASVFLNTQTLKMID